MRIFAVFFLVVLTASAGLAEWVPLQSMLNSTGQPPRDAPKHSNADSNRTLYQTKPAQPSRRRGQDLRQNAAREETEQLANPLQAPDLQTTIRMFTLSKMARDIENRLTSSAARSQPQMQLQRAFPTVPQQQRTPLSIREIQFASTAWNYFRAATNAETGLVRSTLKFPSTTMWDQGGYLMALVSAQRLGLISRPEAVLRARKAIKSLGAIALVNGKFPNKAYNTETLEMTDYANKPAANGIGYSALDIMRLVSGMIALEQEYPEVRTYSQNVRSRWPLNNLVNEGRFWSTTSVGRKANTPLQEGRIGYEQYAGRVGLAIGMDTYISSSFQPILKWHVHDGVPIPGDRRGAKTHGVDAVTTSEPFLLEALEYGWRQDLRQVALGVYVAQVNRFVNTGQLTALSEDHITGPPYFAYDGILVGDRPFESVTPVRKVVNDRRRISTKACFGWWALVPNEYGELLLRSIQHLQTENGWQAGLFEIDNSANTIVTLNTNAVVLEALHYKAMGSIIRNQ